MAGQNLHRPQEIWQKPCMKAWPRGLLVAVVVWGGWGVAAVILLHPGALAAPAGNLAVTFRHLTVRHHITLATLLPCLAFAFEGLQSVARGLAYATQTWGVGGGLPDRPVAAVARHNLRRALIEEQCVWLSRRTGCGGRYAGGPVGGVAGGVAESSRVGRGPGRLAGDWKRVAIRVEIGLVLSG